MTRTGKLLQGEGQIVVMGIVLCAVTGWAAQIHPVQLWCQLVAFQDTAPQSSAAYQYGATSWVASFQNASRIITARDDIPRGLNAGGWQMRRDRVLRTARSPQDRHFLSRKPTSRIEANYLSAQLLEEVLFFCYCCRAATILSC